MIQNVTPIRNEVEGVGKHIKKSKLKYTWEFELASNLYVLDLYHSKLSHKFEIRLNGQHLMTKEDLKKTQFTFRTERDNFIIIVTYSKEMRKFILKINDIKFESYMEFKQSITNSTNTSNNENEFQFNHQNSQDFQRKSSKSLNSRNRTNSGRKNKMINSQGNHHNSQQQNSLKNSKIFFEYEINYMKIFDLHEDKRLVKQIN